MGGNFQPGEKFLNKREVSNVTLTPNSGTLYFSFFQAVISVEASQNFSEIPKKTRFSKIVKGGSRNVVCQTWRPQGWNDGKFLREDYPITFAVEDQKRQKQIENAGNPLCGGEPCSGNITTNITKISPYTGNLIFGTAAVNFREGVNNLESIQVYPCGKSLRRIGGKLPIN